MSGVREEAEFATWLAENASIYRSFERLAFEVIRSGQKHYSADAILHLIRWSRMRRKRDPRSLNNTWTPYLAREFIRRHPRHRHFFRLRKSKADAGASPSPQGNLSL